MSLACTDIFLMGHSFLKRYVFLECVFCDTTNCCEFSGEIMENHSITNGLLYTNIVHYI